jgi:hypothetical protein
MSRFWITLGKPALPALLVGAGIELAATPAPARADIDTDFANQLHGYVIYGIARSPVSGCATGWTPRPTSRRISCPNSLTAKATRNKFGSFSAWQRVAAHNPENALAAIDNLWTRSHTQPETVLRPKTTDLKGF